MIRRYQSHQEAVHHMRQHGQAAFEARQLARRLEALLPLRLKGLKLEWGQQNKGGKALRLALTDERYFKHLEEVVDISAHALESRIQFEAISMLIKAQQSLRRAGPLA